jgi:hypothetical protein
VIDHAGEAAALLHPVTHTLNDVAHHSTITLGGPRGY